MRVVVSGASGLVGRALVPALRAGGHETVVLVRRAAGTGEVPWDPASGLVDGAALEGCDAVVHLSGAGIGDRRWSAARRRQLVASRVDSTALLARTLAGLQRPPSVLVSASAVGVYGDRGDEVLTEDSAPGTGFLSELCQAWEGATAPAHQAGLRVVHLRSAVVLAPDGGALARQLPLFRFGVGGRLGDGRQWLSWISLRDEVGAIAFLLDDDTVAGPVNASSPTPVTNRQFTRALAHAVHRPAPFAVPRAALGLALGRELAAEMVLASQRVVPARLTTAGYRFHDVDLSQTLASVLSRPS